MILVRGGGCVGRYPPPTQRSFYFLAEGTKTRPIWCRFYIADPVLVAPGQIPKADLSHPAPTPLVAQIGVSGPPGRFVATAAVLPNFSELSDHTTYQEMNKT